MSVGLHSCTMGGGQPPPSITAQEKSVSFTSYQTDEFVPPLSTPFTIAILPFESFGSHSTPSWLSHGLPELILSDLARWPSIEVISRKALGSVLREQWLQQRGFSAVQPSVEPGEIKGVHYVIQGIIHSLEGTLTVDLQLIDVETSVVVGTMRSSGLDSNIPQIERELVQQIIHRFQHSEPSSTSIEDFRRNADGSLVPKIEDKHFSSKKDFTNHSVHRIDAELSLERLTLHRQQALGFAEALWKTGLRSELGHVNVQSLELWRTTPETHTLLTIPISVFFDPNRLRKLVGDWEKEGWVSPLDIEEGELHISFASPGDTVDMGSSQLLYEKILEPRRLFVRALSEQGQVLAVYSAGDWKTELPSTPPKEVISFPLAPRVYRQGIAKFPVGWISSAGEHVTFDVLVAPVPREYTRVKFEVIRVQTHGDSGVEDELSDMKRWLRDLEDRIQAQWSPEVLEGLPSGDYLPGNKRTGRLTIFLEEGRVSEVRAHSESHDPLFRKSLYGLQQYLQGFCVICSLGANEKLLEGIAGFRVQLVQVKDIQALNLGGYLP